jgi:protein-disulfide isomerase
MLALVAACGRSTQAPPDTVAQVNGRRITLSEVDARWRDVNAAEAQRALETVYNGRRAALDAIIGDQVVAAAAKARGVSIEQFLRDELARRISPVAEGDVERFFEANKAQAGGQSLEQVRQAIVELLERQHREDARQAMFRDLRGHVTLTGLALEPPRRAVTVSSSDPVRGAANAPVTIVEFSDYQCPFCARVVPTLARVMETYGDRVRIVWKDFPLEEIHPRASALAAAARCAGDQGRYWAFHDFVFANQDAAATLSFPELADRAGVERAAFTRCVDAKRYDHAVADGQFAGHALGVEATPTLFINGRTVSGAQPYDVIARIVDDELDRRR